MKTILHFIGFILLAAILFLGGCAVGPPNLSPDQSPDNLIIPGPVRGFPG